MWQSTLTLVSSLWPTTGVLLEKVRQRYDFVIIDGPPTLGFAESNALAKQAGAIIVVARSGVTKKLSLREAMEALEADMDFLLAGDVFTKDQIGGYMDLKWEEIYAYEHTPHPMEFKMYYSC